MRTSNIVMVVIGLAGVAGAILLAIRGAKLPVVPERPPDGDGRRKDSVGGAVADGIRRVTCILAAGWVAGFLVVGLGGRLVMRIIGATSGDGAQGRLTDAEEVVGEITLGGTVGFVIFAGLVVPIATAFLYLPVRRFLPNRAWQSGLLYSVLLLAVFGISDPLERDSIDFVILSPNWLSVVLVITAAALFGLTLASMVALCERSVPTIGDRGVRWTAWIPYLSLIGLINPIGVPIVVVYLVGRAVSRGRLDSAWARPGVRLTSLGVGAAACLVSLVVVGGVAVDLV